MADEFEPQNSEGSSRKKYSCDVCGVASYSSYAGLWQHKKRNHPEEKFERKFIKCGVCQTCFGTQIELCLHLKSDHGYSNIRVETFDFADQREYLAWRTNVEENGRFNFVQANTKTKRKTSTVEYLRCHRSGYNVVKTKKIAAFKTKSNRLNFCCSCFAKVVTSLTNGRVEVQACLQHYGHAETAARHRRRSLHPEIQNEIVRMLEEGKDAKTILDFFQENPNEGTCIKNSEHYPVYAINSADIQTAISVEVVDAQLSKPVVQKEDYRIRSAAESQKLSKMILEEIILLTSNDDRLAAQVLDKLIEIKQCFVPPSYNSTVNAVDDMLPPDQYSTSDDGIVDNEAIYQKL